MASQVPTAVSQRTTPDTRQHQHDQSQAGRAPGDRLTHTPGGERVDLSAEAMPPGDLYIAVAAHLGEGRFMLNVIDPSVVDEHDPTGPLARVMTSRAWLSTWSGLSSQADLPDTIGHVTIPTLIVYADGDCDIFPAEQRELLEKSGAADKTAVELPWANHYLHPVGEEGARLPASARPNKPPPSPSPTASPACRIDASMWHSRPRLSLPRRIDASTWHDGLRL